jgi:hypothetical protein
MKKIVFLSLNLLWTTFLLAQVVNIPDANFKQALVDNSLINTNKNTEIEVSEAVAYTGKINVSYKKIENLTGIEAFVNITGLDCGNNLLMALDVSKNIALTSLGCSYNSLKTLDVSKNINLTFLSCKYNSINALDVSKNVALTYLDCFQNTINVLNVENNINLITLSCSSNKLTNLDVSKNIALTRLNCSNNLLTYLNVKNGTNNILNFFYADQNIQLKCIKVDNSNIIGINWTKDPTASYSSNCMIPTKEISSEGFLQLYPNPSMDSFAFSNLSEAPLSVAIYDLHGKLVQHYLSPASNYDISTLCNGLYIVKAQFANGEAIAKLLKGE